MAKYIFWSCLTTTIVLLVASFIVPPTGVIDSSVLTAGGILFAFATLGKLPDMIKGRSVELKHGNTTINFGDDDEEKSDPIQSAEEN